MNLPPGFEEGDDDLTTRFLIDNDYMDVSIDPDTEEPVYRMNKNCKRDFPEFYEAWLKAAAEEIDEAVATLVQAGLIEAKGVDERGEITLGLTELGQEVLASQKQS